MKVRELKALLDQCDANEDVEFLLNECFVLTNDPAFAKKEDFGGASFPYEIEAQVMMKDGRSMLNVEISQEEIRNRLKSLRESVS